jgi:hypothetical protein
MASTRDDSCSTGPASSCRFGLFDSRRSFKVTEPSCLSTGLPSTLHTDFRDRHAPFILLRPSCPDNNANRQPSSWRRHCWGLGFQFRPGDASGAEGQGQQETWPAGRGLLDAGHRESRKNPRGRVSSQNQHPRIRLSSAVEQAERPRQVETVA